MFTTDDLTFDEDGHNVIKVRLDPSCEMAGVFFNDGHVLTGNYWDFHPGCYGHDLGQDFRGWHGLVAVLEGICKQRGQTSEVRKIKTTFGDVSCDWEPDPVVFTLNTCGLCPCGATSLAVHIEGDGGGLRLTDSSLGVWRTVETIEPGDPRYRMCIELLQHELEHGYEPRRPEVQRYLDHLPKIDDLEALERKWMADWRAKPITELMTGDFWDAWNRLNTAGVSTCGELADHTQASMVRDLSGVGRATAMAVARAFGRKRLVWSHMRQSA